MKVLKQTTTAKYNRDNIVHHKRDNIVHQGEVNTRVSGNRLSQFHSSSVICVPKNHE